MKVLVIVALFALVAVQICQSAPVDEVEVVKTEEKSEKPVENQEGLVVPSSDAPVEDIALTTSEAKLEPLATDVTETETPALKKE